MRFQMKENGFITDLEYGQLHISADETYGFRPYQLLVSSLAVCSGGVLRKVLNKMRLQVEDIQISAQVERNEAIANRVEKVHLLFEIKGENLPSEKIEKALVLTRKNCSMVQSVIDSIEVTESFKIIE